MDGLTHTLLAFLLLLVAISYLIATFRGAMLVFEASTTLGIICLCLSLFTGIGSLVFVIPAAIYWCTGTNIAQSIAKDLGL